MNLDFLKNLTPEELGSLSALLGQSSSGRARLFDGGQTSVMNPQSSDSFLSSIFGDKGVMQGIGSTISGLGNLYLGYQGLKNAKKQQAFNNAASSYQLNNQAKIFNDTVDQRSQSHASSKGLKGEERDSYVTEQNKKTQLSEFRR